jgi:PAS domain S-box-containing protein
MSTTGKQQDDKALQALETRFRIVADNTYDWEFWLSPDNRFLYSSPSCKRITGHAPEEFLADPGLLQRLIHPDDWRRYETHRRHVSHTPHTHEEEFRIVRPDGSVCWIGHVCGPVYDENGKFLGTRGSNRDITDRKRTEEALRESEEKHRLLFESSRDAIMTLAPPNWRFTSGNSATLKMFGVKTEAEFIALRPWELSPKRQSDGRASTRLARQLIGKALREGSIVFEWMHQRANGETFPATVLLSRIQLGEKTLLHATVRDITEQKRIEETLRKSEARFRSLLQDIPSIAVQGYAPDGTTQYWNRASERLYGYTAQEAIGRNLVDLIIPPEMRPDVERAIRHMAATGQAIPASELSLMRKDGSRVAVFSSHAIIQVPGRPQELFCIDVDLTERKKAESELRRSETNLQIAFDAAQLGQWHWDIAAGNLSWSPQCLTLYGLPANTTVTLKMFENAIHPDDRQRVLAALRHAVETHTDYAIEKRILHPNGSVRWTTSRGRCTYDDTGRPLRMDGVSFDITERKQAEHEVVRLNQNLRRRIAELQAIFDTSPIGLSIADDPQSLHIRGNPAVERLVGVKPGGELSVEHPPRVPFRVLRDGKPLPASELPIQRACRGESVIGQILDVLRPDGKTVTLYSSAAPLLDEHGKPRGAVAAFMDITELKQTQQALEATGTQLRALAAHLQTVREQERVRLAREVHDEFGHAFTYLKLDLAWLDRRLKEKSAPGLSGMRRKISAMIKRVERDLESVRRISTELRPAVLDTLGLAAAMEWAAKQFETRTHIACKLNLAPEALALDSGRSTALFRAFQEILTNVVRHAHASRVRVRMKVEAGRLVLTVVDNGRGITKQETTKTNAMGLLGIRERAIEFGGEMSIHGSRGKGTTVTVTIPLERP